MSQANFTASKPRLESVLIIDDNKADAFLLEKYLTRVFDDRELRISQTKSLATAIACLENNEFDLITLDLMLPDTTELESIAAIRVKAPKSAIVLVSGLEDEATSKKALRLGAQDYLIKGKFDDPKELRWSLESSFERQSTYNRMFERQQSEQDLHELKSRILSLTAHDIRSPLVGVISFLEKIMSDQMISGLSESQKNIFGMMLNNCHEVVRMADGLADAQRSRLKLFELQIEKVILKDYVQEVYALIKSQMDEKNIRFEFDLTNAAKETFFDPFLIKRALQNLLANAVRYSPPGSKIQLCIQSVQDKTIFSVKDEGEGIQPELVEKALAGKLGSKREEINEQDGRVGLGLRIVDQIARSHEGQIKCEKRKDSEGSVFSIDLKTTLDRKDCTQ